MSLERPERTARRASDARATADRAAHQDELIPLVQDWLLTFPDNDSLMERCRLHRVPLGPVLDPVDALGHPHYEPVAWCAGCRIRWWVRW